MAAAAVALVVAVGGAALGVQALDVRRALADARAELAGATEWVLDGDLSASRASVDDARAAVLRARSSTDGLLWTAASTVPVAGRTPRTVRSVVDVADGAIAVLDSGLHGLDGLAARGELQMPVDEGRLDLDLVLEMADALRDLPIEDLETAHRNLAAAPVGLVPAVVREGRLEALELSHRTLEGVTAAQQLSAVLPGFLGSDGPRHYFVGMQQPAEIRGTGGLLGFFSIIQVEDGQISVDDPIVLETDLDEARPDDEDGEIAQRLFAIGREAGFAVPAPQDYRARYEHVGAGGNFQNINVDPDLPSVASVLLSLYEFHTEEQLDGVILLDPIALETLLEPVGAIEMDAALLDPDGRLPERVPPDQVAELITYEIYEIYGRGRQEERRAFFRDFASRSFEAIFAGTWEGFDFVRRIAEATNGRHLQIFSVDDEEEAAFRQARVGGHFSAGEEHDLLAVVANNAVGGKMDVHLGHRIDAEFDLVLPERVHPHAPRASRRGPLRVSVDNPLPADGMDRYIIGNCLPAQRGCGQEGPPGVNRTWFTLWTPADTYALNGRDHGGVTHAWSGALHGMRTYDRYLETASESEGWFEVELEGEVALERDGGELVYRFSWWRQAKAIPDLFDVTFQAPEGWSVTGTDLRGGEGPGRLGVHADAESVRVEATSDQVRVRGAVSSDLEVEIRFGRNFLLRTWDWLQEPAF